MYLDYSVTDVPGLYRTGFAARPGTLVLPACSIAVGDDAMPRSRRADSSWKSLGHRGS